MRKIILSILMISTLTVFSFPFVPETNAGVITFTGCATGGIAAPYLSDLINKGLRRIAEYLPRIGSFFGLGSVPVSDEKLETSKYVLDVIARCTARELLAKINGNIVKTARTSGRDGGVTWVKNWRNYETNAQYRGENVFRAMLSTSNVCEYFSKDLKKSFGVSDKKVNLPGQNLRSDSLTSFATQIGCTMPKGFSPTALDQDFGGNGGWSATSRMLEPQNNYYGSILLSLDEMQKQRDIEKNADINDAMAGSGQTSIRGKTARDSCLVQGVNGKCVVYKDIKTPASYIKDNLQASLQSELAWLTSTQYLEGVIADATQALFNRLTNLGGDDGGLLIPGESGYDPSTLPTPPPGGGTCNAVDPTEGSYPRYQSDLVNAAAQYVSQNLDVVIQPASDTVAVDKYLRGIAGLMVVRGYLAGRAINCNGNLGKDSIMVGRLGEAYGDYFDLINGAAREEGKTIREAGQILFVQWAGMERLVTGGPGGPTPTPGSSSTPNPSLPPIPTPEQTPAN